ncbi:MAG: bifunctional glycosyltransferase family 2/GtrA family protein [Lachnospiraceae bacterium]|nr:bifunctional glycosyltransferase family 2/GtrA family protein [Lachnospiraceae bacterium]
MRTKRIALIPAYEPDDALVNVAERLRERNFEIVVVDDGSGENYRKLFENVEEIATVLRHPENRGKGAALKTGLRFIADCWEGPLTVVTVDADGQHRPEDVIRVCDQSEKLPGYLVLGSRKMKGKVPLRSRLGNGITRLVYRISSGVRIYDTQTGLRAFSGQLIPWLLKIPGERYEYEMNMLMSFAREGRPMKEVEIETVYLDGNSSSHFDTVKDSCRIYKEIIRFSGSSFISFCLDYLMYALMLAAGLGVTASNILARVVSGTVNYTLNRKLVFNSDSSVSKSALQYLALSAFILAMNTVILKGLVYMHVSRYAAKILAEAMMFAVSWAIQHRFIFRKAATA